MYDIGFQNLSRALISNLPAVNEMMPPFEGTDAERRALADFLSTRAPRDPGEPRR